MLRIRYVLGMPEEIFNMIMVELGIIVLWVVKIRVLEPLLLKRRVSSVFKEGIALPRLRTRDVLLIGLSNPWAAAAYASFTYTLIVAYLVTVLAFQPYDPAVLTLAIALYATSIVFLALAYRESRRRAEELLASSLGKGRQAP